MERMLLRYFVNDEWAARGYQPLDSIFEQIARPSGWRSSFFDQLQTPEEKGALSAILERMASDGLLERKSSPDSAQVYYRASDNALTHPRYDYLYPRFVHEDETDERAFSDAERHDLYRAIDSTNWTGLSKKIGPKDVKAIREKSKLLQQAIMQSDSDIQTKMDACKRVEAVIVLLEAPNAPWPEIVRLLSHPTVASFLATLSLLQFIVGLAQ